ncbi:helix-turn-helix domain-containing protein [Treponema sp.]|uniref:helix-turn-helix domain-containing protein n=1 Tax=Treponema sp. TaxID=166 RepID=UPI003F0BC6F8
MLDFWCNVKNELEYNLMTQKELADKMQISYNTLQSWITKDRLPDARQSVQIAKILNTTVEFLVTGRKTPLSQDNAKIINLLNQAIGYLK